MIGTRRRSTASFKRLLRWAAMLACVVIASGARPAAAVSGDCDGDGAVKIGELIRAVRIALELDPLGICLVADYNGDGRVDIVDLIVLVNIALGIEVPAPTPTAPGFDVVDLGAAGGQPCNETTFDVQLADTLAVDVARLSIDFCVNPGAFKIADITCRTFNSAPMIERVDRQPTCALAGTDPHGQTHVEVSGHGGSGGTSLEPSDQISCSIPVFPQTPGGTYPLRYRVVAETSAGTVVSAGQVTITVFGINFSDVFTGGCCYLDTHCQSGFCRDGDAARDSVCCAVPCNGGVCNAPGFEGECCAASGLPDVCTAP